MKHDALENLVQLMKTDAPSWKLGPQEHFWSICLDTFRAMPGAAHKIEKIACESDPEPLGDILAEVKFAVIFAKLGYDVEIEPCRSGSSPNPDMRITKDGHSAFVEVMRRRHESGRSLQAKSLNTDEVFVEYGDSKDPRRIYEALERKFRQAGVGGIIAIWDDGDVWEPEEYESAAHSHIQTISASRSAFVVLHKYQNMPFCCYQLRRPLEPYLQEWLSALSSMIPDSIFRQMRIEILSERLQTYEPIHGYSIVDIHRRYLQGQLGKDADLVEWAELYSLWLTR